MADADSKKEPPQALSPLELALMEVIWELGECSSADVIAKFNETRSLAPTTIRTVLSKIRKKGYIEPVPTIERGFRIRPIIGRETLARKSLAELLVSSLFRGSPQQAICYLLEDHDLSDEELDEIRRKVAEIKRRSRKK